MATTQSIPDDQLQTADEKARLIGEALRLVRRADTLDEDEQFGSDVAQWTAWYDRTFPELVSLEQVVAAMKGELVKRRGERVIAEGERRGRPAQTEKVSHRETISNAEKLRRHKARTIAAHPAPVTAYEEQEHAAGRVPSNRGRFRAAKESQQMSQVAVAPTVPAKTPALTAGEMVSQRALSELFRKLDAVADGTRRTDGQLAKLLGDVKGFLERVRVIPWLSVDRTTDGLQFVIDQELRDICERRRPRPSLKGESIRTFLTTLRAEIDRRRKENHDKNLKAKWVTREVNVQQQRDLLDWIEQQLELITL